MNTIAFGAVGAVGSFCIGFSSPRTHKQLTTLGNDYILQEIKDRSTNGMKWMIWQVPVNIVVALILYGPNV